MKKLMLTLLALSFFTTIFAVTTSTAIQLDVVNGVEFEDQISLQDFASLSIKDIQKKTGKKLNLGQKIALKLAKRKIKKIQKRGGSLEDMAKGAASGGGFHWGPFLLGFFLGLIGVLITWLVWDEREKTKYSWYGFIAIVLLTLVLSVSIS